MKKIVTYSALFVTFNCFAEDIEFYSEEQNQYTKTTDDNNSVFSRLKHMFSKDGEDELNENKIVEVSNSSTQIENNNLKEQLSEIQNTQSKETQKTDNEFNRVAYRIAGLDNDTSDEYQKYSAPITQKWQTLCDSSLMKVRPWWTPVCRTGPVSMRSSRPCLWKVPPSPSVNFHGNRWKRRT